MKGSYKALHVVDPDGEWHGKTIDIEIAEGKIASINASTKKESNLLLMPSLFDAQVQSGEPGYEDRETIESLKQSAATGGFGALAILPSTQPVIDSKSVVKFIKEANKLGGPELFVYGAISERLAGESMAELFDMHQAGAIAFSDAKHPLQDVNLMKRALEYVKGFDGLVCSFPLDERIAPGGMVNESKSNTTLGLKLTPSLAEEIAINRDLFLLRYTGSKLHFSTLSSKSACEMVGRAKSDGLDVTCAVALPNLLFDEGQLQSFDSNYKTSPPLRSAEDRSALINAVKAGVIDMICTDHTPMNIENKVREFDHALPGMIMLQTALSAINMHLMNDLSWDDVVRTMSINPRKRFKVDVPELKVGARWNHTIFDTKAEWELNNQSNASLSINSPFWHQKLVGKVVGID